MAAMEGRNPIYSTRPDNNAPRINYCTGRCQTGLNHQFILIGSQRISRHNCKQEMRYEKCDFSTKSQVF